MRYTDPSQAGKVQNTALVPLAITSGDPHGWFGIHIVGTHRPRQESRLVPEPGGQKIKRAGRIKVATW
jgi:hypothetical protein